MEQWDSILTNQGGKCAICRSPNPTTKQGWHTDHCHKTGKVRGILCKSCNVALGEVKDRIDVVKNMLEYLRVHNG